MIIQSQMKIYVYMYIACVYNMYAYILRYVPVLLRRKAGFGCTYADHVMVKLKALYYSLPEICSKYALCCLLGSASAI